MGIKVTIVTIKINKKYIIFFATLFLVFLLLISSILLSGNISIFNSYFYINETVGIDPGHGGIDTGTYYKNFIFEKNINLDVALEVKKILKSNNLKVIMTREGDISLEDKSGISASRYRRDLDARKSIINNNADIFVSIHVNSNPYSPSTRGVLIYHYPGSEEGKKLAEIIGKSIDEIVYEDYLNNTGLRSEVLSDDYYILRETRVPGVLIEIGFITNPQERMLLLSNTYKKKMAEAIGGGIIEYLILKND